MTQANSVELVVCGKKAILYLKDISENPINKDLTELYMCSKHAWDFREYQNSPPTLKKIWNIN